MTGSLKFRPGIFYLSTQLKYPENDIFKAPGILEIIFQMMGFLKYKPGNLNCICHLNFPEVDFF